MRSTRYALLLAAGYVALATAYIVISSGIAARMSVSVEDMARIETFKGVVYVGVTGVGVFLGAWLALRAMERAGEQLRHRDRALLANERRIFAGLMAASIAHDANNVLVAVLGDLYELRESLGADDEKLKRLQLSVERLAALNQRLLHTTRQGRNRTPEPFDLVGGVRDSLAVVGSHRELRGCRTRVTGEAAIEMRTHPLLVHQIVSNLVVNAAEATRGRGQVEVRLGREPGAAVIEVHDDGPGVPPEMRARIFEALETTKADGSGLGLFSVRSCATALGGGVEVDTSPLGGACFRVRLPLDAAA